MTSRYWFSVDSDDLHHHPSISGHPTRSKITPWCLDLDPRPMSNTLIHSFNSLQKWWQTRGDEEILTIFVVAEQFEGPFFVDAIRSIQHSRPGLRIGIHGLKHICWSAWGNRSEEFNYALSESIRIIQTFSGAAFRPWFRAPGGYIAPWMIPILKSQGITLDSSINPVWLLRKKTGKNENKRINGWQKVRNEIIHNGIIEREWLVKRGLPTNGPALHIPFLRHHSKWTWKRELSNLQCSNDQELLDPTISMASIYWHVLDHSRQVGWTPPLPQIQASLFEGSGIPNSVLVDSNNE